MIRKSPVSQRGFSIIETMIAIVVLTVGLLGVLSMFGFAISTNASQGNYATHTTDYAQDKMEQLMGLKFTDTTSTTVGGFTTSTGGTGLTPGGGVTPGAPVTGFVDYIDANGDPAQASAFTNTFYYVRQWQITLNADGSKTIVVLVRAIGIPGSAPSSTLASIKANI
jgi:prepilin-type N-terminal cleavage/methylation domain-containing protein